MGDLAKIVSSQHPVNILYLAAYIREQGYEVRVIDYEVEPYQKENLWKTLEETSPLLVGITCFTPLIVTGHRIAEAVKEAFPKMPVAVGGPHPTALARQTLDEFPSFDYAVQGEGEETLLELCQALRRGTSPAGIAGLACRQAGEVVSGAERPRIKELDTLPMPARDLLDMDRYPGAAKSGMAAEIYRTTQVFTARGCPFPCTFCAIFLTTTRTVRYRSLDNLRRELLECKSRYGIEHVNVHDDTFTVKASRVREISRLLGEMGFTWDCDTRVDTVSREMIEEMAAGGCRRIAFGVESGSDRMQKLMKKNVTADHIRRAFGWCRDTGMMTSAYFIVGAHPDETLEDLEATRKLMFDIRPDFVNVAIGTPYPGTELYQQLEAEGLILDRDWSRYMLYDRLPSWRTKQFSPEDLLRIQAELIRSYFYRPAYVWQKLKQIQGLKELLYWARSAWVGLQYTQKGFHLGRVLSH
jgi:radical SAM superfamily enzyme YgiQ (UPF0313 family)